MSDARAERRRARRASGSQAPMVEAVTVHLDKATARELRRAMPGVSTAEAAGGVLKAALQAMRAGAEAEATKGNLVLPATPQQTVAVAYRGTRTGR